MQIKAVKLAKKLNISKQAVYNWLKAGCPYFVRTKGLRDEIWVNEEEVNSWLGERQVGRRGKDKKKRKSGSGHPNPPSSRGVK